MQRRLAWPLRKDDTQNREAFHIFLSALHQTLIFIQVILLIYLISIRHFANFWKVFSKKKSQNPTIADRSELLVRHLLAKTFLIRRKPSANSCSYFFLSFFLLSFFHNTTLIFCLFSPYFFLFFCI